MASLPTIAAPRLAIAAARLITLLLDKVMSRTKPFPIGRWRCTVSNAEYASDFRVGEIYVADYLPDTLSIRVWPYAGSYWSLYWDARLGRFNYPTD